MDDHLGDPDEPVRIEGFRPEDVEFLRSRDPAIAGEAVAGEPAELVGLAPDLRAMCLALGCVSKRTSTAITGHKTRKDSSDGDYAPSPKPLKKVIERYPRYTLDPQQDATAPSESEAQRNADTPDPVT